MFGGHCVKHSFSFAADLSNGAVKKEASTKEVARIWINDIKMRSFSPTVVSGTNYSFAETMSSCDQLQELLIFVLRVVEVLSASVCSKSRLLHKMKLGEMSEVNSCAEQA